MSSMKLLKAFKTNKAPELDNLPASICKRSFGLIHVFLTLGARDFSRAVSVFCQVFIVTQASSLVASAFGRPRNVSAALDHRAREKPLVPRVWIARWHILVLVDCINLSLTSGFFVFDLHPYLHSINHVQSLKSDYNLFVDSQWFPHCTARLLNNKKEFGVWPQGN